jgi:hypothetical protein
MRFAPKLLSGSEGINTGLCPPCEFVTRAVNLAMMTAAKWDDEFVADLTSQGSRLREPQMVRRLSSAYQTRPPSDVFQVMAVAKPPRFR